VPYKDLLHTKIKSKKVSLLSENTAFWQYICRGQVRNNKPRKRRVKNVTSKKNGETH